MKRQSEIECGDRVCILEHFMLQNCYVYLYDNSTDCEIPCKLESCQRQLHHFIYCPVWKCSAISTTTFSTTTLSTTTTTPFNATTTTSFNVTTTHPSPPTTTAPFKPDHPALIYSSYALNVALLVCLLFVIIGKCKKALRKCFERLRRNRANRNGSESNDRTPILREFRANANYRYNPLLERRLDDIFVLDDIETESESQSQSQSGFTNVDLHANSSTPTVPTGSLHLKCKPKKGVKKQGTPVQPPSFRERDLFARSPPTLSGSSSTFQTHLNGEGETFL